MSMITLTTACNPSLSQTLPFGNKNNNNLRDASFSSYLNGSEEIFIRKLAESSGSLVPVITTEEQQTQMGTKKEDEEEIGVFGAEKYFNGVMDDESASTASMSSARKYQHKKEEGDEIGTRKYKVQPQTPSVHSESSWNSQSALLQVGLKNPSRTKAEKVRRKRILAILCKCSDKDAVEIREQVGEISFNKSATPSVVQGKANKREPRKTELELVDAVQVHTPHLDNKVEEEMHSHELDELGIGLNRENCFTFPTLNSGVGTMPIKCQVQEELEKIPRKSLEVFGSPVLERRNKSLSLERRLTMLSWDAAPRVEDHEFSVPSGVNYNDTESDASSDLFEIESLTGKANPFLARQASDATSGCVTPTTCYAPSEASIEWSVVTASAADVSVMSDCEELRPTKTVSSAIIDAKTKTNKEIQKRRSGILLGCKSHKAVRVAGDAYKTIEKANVYPQMQRSLDSFTPVTRFQAETKLTGFNSSVAIATRTRSHSLPRPQSPHATNVLHI
ncbi:protein PHYTOCHROME KINASE SUBSTRATE 1-like [Quercus robur]|uniref:protein PHYTOCHROME KINASE SUBSTRATE 1-like n=1 Tax=Quercus robur TaxID=38942 RepID=UPI0021624DB2|nr:protein PHYTOCHROME KINASE SUBSTRATE 1-like [Quercus robur]